MPRNGLLIRLLAVVVGIVAIALGAATIRSPTTTGGSGSGGDTGYGSPPPPPEESTGGEIPAFLEYLLYALAILSALALAWYLIVHRRDAVKQLAIGLVVALVLALGLYALLQISSSVPTNETLRPGIPGPIGEPGTTGTSGEGSGDRTTTPFEPLLAVLAAITAIFVGALLLSGDDTDEEFATEPDVESASDDDRVKAVGAAAGRAADRIETATDVDNEVYRAWREMTELLSVPRPNTSTPGEFAAAAVETGLNPDHVGELTRLFEDVRYGHEETTAAMESRAVAVLERIEAEYAEDATTEPRGDGR